VLPAVFPAETVLGRTAAATVSLSRLWVYPTGFEFRLLVDLKDEWSDLDPFQFRSLRRGQDGDLTSPERLNFGFAFADGSKATNRGRRRLMDADPDSPSPTLTGMGASSGGGHASASFWLWPLPPPGPIEAVCEWEAAGLPLIRCELDGEAIAAAARRPQKIFEDHDAEGWS
jgi:hypothetical protein